MTADELPQPIQEATQQPTLRIFMYAEKIQPPSSCMCWTTDPDCSGLQFLEGFGLVSHPLLAGSLDGNKS